LQPSPTRNPNIRKIYAKKRLKGVGREPCPPPDNPVSVAARTPPSQEVPAPILNTRTRYTTFLSFVRRRLYELAQ